MTKHSWTCLRGVLGSYRACTSVLQEENFAGNSQGGGCACCPGNSALSREGHSTPKLPWRSPSKGHSMDMPPTHTKHLGCLPCRTRGLLPDKFPALQGRTKHSRAACHSSRSHAPSPNIRNALWGSTLEIWGYYLALPLSPEETSTLLEMPARNMGHLPGMHMPPTDTKRLRWLPRRTLGLLPPSPQRAKTPLEMPDRSSGELPAWNFPQRMHRCWGSYLRIL